MIAPQIGPNEAPMKAKTAMHLPATPETARAMETTQPMPQETHGLTLGRVVLIELAAISEEKQALGKAVIASAKASHLAALAPKIAPIRFIGFRSTLPAARAALPSAPP